MKLFINDVSELVNDVSPIAKNGGAKLINVIYGLFMKLKDKPLILQGFIENEAYKASVSGQEGIYGYMVYGLEEPIGASTLAHIVNLMGLSINDIKLPKPLAISWANSKARKMLAVRVSFYASSWAKNGSPYKGLEAFRLHTELANDEAPTEA
jgi:hypothetical protein